MQNTATSRTWQEEVEAVNTHAEGHGAVKIGILTPLSPPGDATAGNLIMRGACLGAEYLREHGGRRVEIVVQNDQQSAAEEGMPKSAVAGAAKLIMIDKVIALLGQWHLRTAPHVAEIAERLGVPNFIENGHNEVTLRRNTFRTYYSIADRVPFMLEVMAQLNCRRISIVTANTVFGLMITDSLEKINAEAGFDFEIQRIEIDQESTRDVSEPIRRVQEFQPDLIVNAGVVRTNYMIHHRAYDVGLLPSTPMMSCYPYPMRSADYWEELGEKGNHLMWPGVIYRPSMEGLSEIGRWFTRRYEQSYGSFPPDNVLNAFTDVTIIGQALDAAESETREGLQDALENGTFETWHGPIRFRSKDGHWHHHPPPIVIMQYQHVGQTFDEAPIIHPPELKTAEIARV